MTEGLRERLAHRRGKTRPLTLALSLKGRGGCDAEVGSI